MDLVDYPLRWYHPPRHMSGLQNCDLTINGVYKFSREEQPLDLYIRWGPHCADFMTGIYYWLSSGASDTLNLIHELDLLFNQSMRRLPEGIKETSECLSPWLVSYMHSQTASEDNREPSGPWEELFRSILRWPNPVYVRHAQLQVGCCFTASPMGTAVLGLLLGRKTFEDLELVTYRRQLQAL